MRLFGNAVIRWSWIRGFVDLLIWLTIVVCHCEEERRSNLKFNQVFSLLQIRAIWFELKIRLSNNRITASPNNL